MIKLGGNVKKSLIIRLIENFGLGYLVNSLYGVTNEGVSRTSLINLTISIFLIVIAFFMQIKNKE